MIIPRFQFLVSVNPTNVHWNEEVTCDLPHGHRLPEMLLPPITHEAPRSEVNGQFQKQGGSTGEPRAPIPNQHPPMQPQYKLTSEDSHEQFLLRNPPSRSDSLVAASCQLEFPDIKRDKVNPTLERFPCPRSSILDHVEPVPKSAVQRAPLQHNWGPAIEPFSPLP